ncbi:MAG: hypothetical protein HOO06_02335 [Bdellovibrionaceae bacterium]|jgi:hypothetical protein|nr:hypothetical protein [Pseudobdellovibrionaceae bacterium]
MKLYLRILALFYLFGAILHLGDVLNLRLNFSEMDTVWQTWIVFLLIGDTIATIGLWQYKKYGEIAFVLIACAQLIAYLKFKSIFGDQAILIIFHVVTLSLFLGLKYWTNKQSLA